MYTTFVNIYGIVVYGVDCPELSVCFSVSDLRLTSQASNGSALYGKAPHLHPSSSLWLRRTPSCAASAGAWRQTCWACGGGTRHLDAESSGSSGGAMIPTLLSSSTTSFQVGSLTFSISQLLIINSQHLTHKKITICQNVKFLLIYFISYYDECLFLYKDLLWMFVVI